MEGGSLGRETHDFGEAWSSSSISLVADVTELRAEAKYGNQKNRRCPRECQWSGAGGGGDTGGRREDGERREGGRWREEKEDF